MRVLLLVTATLFAAAGCARLDPLRAPTTALQAWQAEQSSEKSRQRIEEDTTEAQRQACQSALSTQGVSGYSRCLAERRRADAEAERQAEKARHQARLEAMTPAELDEACRKDGLACNRLNALRDAAEKAQRDKMFADIAEDERHRAEREAEQKKLEEADAAEEEALRRRCGKDYASVHMGMVWDEKGRECAEALYPFAAVREDSKGIIYENAEYVIRVKNGKIQWWEAK